MSITNKVSNKSVMPGITAVPDVVDAPTIGSATAGTESATVTYTAAATGGAATSFTAISTPSSITGSSATSPITVSGLTAGTAYTFKVYGANSSGTWSVNQSSASNSVTPTAQTAFQSIATVNGTGSATSVEFTNIPNTYTHLQIRGIIQPNNPSGGGATIASMRINNDTGTNYTHHYLRSDGASVTTAGGGSQNYGLVALSTQGNATNVFTGFVLDILDYANTNKLKTIKTFGGYDANGSGNIALMSCLWQSTNAITSIKIFANDGFNLNVSANATFALYGIKAAA